MLYTYDFSLDKLSKLIKDNFPYRGKKGMERDVEIIYYFLIQKYSLLDIPRFAKQLESLLDLSPKEIDDKMLAIGFCDND